MRFYESPEEGTSVGLCVTVFHPYQGIFLSSLFISECNSLLECVCSAACNGSFKCHV